MSIHINPQAKFLDFSLVWLNGSDPKKELSGALSLIGRRLSIYYKTSVFIDKIEKEKASC